MPLPSLVKDRLVKRDSLDIAIKKSNEYRVREYIKNYLNDLEEIVWVLDKLPEKQFKKLYKDEDVYRLLDIANRAAIHLDFWPIRRNEDGILLAVKRLLAPPAEGLPRMFSISREATDQDKERFNNLQMHIGRLEKFVQPLRCTIYNESDKIYFKELAMMAKKAGYKPSMVPERKSYLPQLTPEQHRFRQIQSALAGLGFSHIDSPEDLERLREAMHSDEGKTLKEKMESMIWKQAHPGTEPFPDQETR
jgi:predicted DNA-binding protein